MGDTARRVFTGQPGARRSLVRGTSLPAAPSTLDASMQRLVARLRAMDAAAPRCAAGSCPRRPMPSGPLCGRCARRSVDPVEIELRADGWEPVVHGGERRGWRDPVTGRTFSAQDAVAIVRRDAAQGGAR